ncbi:Nodulation protein W [Thiocapsa sp. KS1]|nr:response regulator [Thiocapsa sp. KS1]CRI67547.1 Nodulation protein W [Thiocapsa sp. KS1]
MSTTPLIHVVEDDDSLRTALLRLLSAGGFESCGYPSAGDFLLDPPLERPGCLLLDVRLPGPSGLDLQAALRRQGINLPIVFMTAYADLASGVAAMKAGAVDFLIKPIERGPLFDAIGRALVRDARERDARQEVLCLRALLDALSPRELAVFRLASAGQRNKQIAAALGIAERTVKLQRARLMAKLGVDTPTELGRLAERLQRLTS